MFPKAFTFKRREERLLKRFVMSIAQAHNAKANAARRLFWSTCMLLNAQGTFEAIGHSLCGEQGCMRSRSRALIIIDGAPRLYEANVGLTDVDCVTLPFNVYLLGARPSEGGCEVCMLLDGWRYPRGSQCWACSHSTAKLITNDDSL